MQTATPRPWVAYFRAKSSGCPRGCPPRNTLRDRSRQVCPLSQQNATQTDQGANTASQDNGGRIALLEKDADILIADPMRKAIAPTGACSYKLIEDSVSNGVLQLEDRYVIAVDAPEVRKPGSSAPTRRGRVPFSAQDDALLAKWVLSHPDPRTGNILYQKLEAVVCHGTPPGLSWGWFY